MKPMNAAAQPLALPPEPKQREVAAGEVAQHAAHAARDEHRPIRLDVRSLQLGQVAPHVVGAAALHERGRDADAQAMRAVALL